MATRTSTVMATIRAARESNYLLYLYAICDQSGCAMRTMVMFVKDYDSTMLAALEQAGGIRCPLCGRITVLERVRTREEELEARDRNARFSVNAQMYIRDGSAAVPLNLRDDLPPTPPGWWDPDE